MVKSPKTVLGRSSLVAQWFKDLVLSLLSLGHCCAWVWSLIPELPHSVGAAKKKKSTKHFVNYQRILAIVNIIM